MCGIAGYVGDGNKTKLDKMLDAIKSRGPDDRGTWINGQVGLGNNRLSIIDLSINGHQPMFNEDETVCVVYNGEIYNFQEIKKQLLRHKFNSNTDTEVLLHAYEEWGPECLRHLNGMFAFVIYDKKKNMLFGARDRLGEKPLKYYWDGKLFAFASEVKGLFPILPQKPGMDHQAINDYLTLQYVPTPYTGFKNVFKLPPASYFIFQKGRLKIAKYWEVDFSSKLKLGEQEWENLLFEKMEESVKSRMISDVPVGAFLSGGVDSSAVVALMASFSKKKIKTFNIGFDDPEFDETKYAKQVSDLYKTEHYSLKVNAKMMQDTLLGSCDFYDEPFADNSFIPTLILSKMTSKKVKVALSGDGGDENFGGYERYRVVLFSKIYKSAPRFLREKIISKLVQVSSSAFKTRFLDRAAIFSKTLSLPFSERYTHYNSFFTRELKTSLFSKDFLRKTKDRDTFSLFSGFYNSDLSDLDNAFKRDINSYLPEDLLYKVDIASMASSLEVRTPLLNHELLELTAQMPDSLKVSQFNQKLIFKKLLKKRKILPSEILERPKRGFIAPIDLWMKTDLKDYIVDQLTTSKMKELGIFDEKKIESYLSTYFSNQHQDKNNVFALLSLAGWANKYL